MRRIVVAVYFAAGFALSFVIFGLPPKAPAQVPGTGVQVLLPITPGNCVQWVNPYTITDAGKVC